MKTRSKTAEITESTSRRLRQRKAKNSEAAKKSKPSISKRKKRSRNRKFLPAAALDIVDGPSPMPYYGDEDIDIVDGGALRYYPMRNRGHLIIINNMEGPNQRSFPRREGSMADADRLRQCFEILNFKDFTIIENQTCKAMKDLFFYCSSVADFSRVDCVVFAILTHGDNPNLLKGVDGECVSYEELIKPLFEKFNDSLIGKPKIFLIQSCLGGKPAMGVKDMPRDDPAPLPFPRDDTPRLPPEIQPMETNSKLLPLYADRLIALATVPGFEAYRDPNRGSWFIEQLTESLVAEYYPSRQRNPRHLVDVLTEVQGRITNRILGKLGVQMPELRSTLRGPIYF